MAYLLLGRLRRPRRFLPRVGLESLRDIDLKEYRLSRDIIEEIVGQYSQTHWPNVTNRTHALTPEQEVSQNPENMKIISIYFPYLGSNMATSSRTPEVCYEKLFAKEI
jgi:hypothetical protein